LQRQVVRFICVAQRNLIVSLTSWQVASLPRKTAPRIRATRKRSACWRPRPMVFCPHPAQVSRFGHS
jgi:hypothetical protein